MVGFWQESSSELQAGCFSVAENKERKQAYKDTDPIHGDTILMTSLNPNYLSMVSPPNSIILGEKFSTYEF